MPFLLAGLPILGNLITALVAGLVGFFAQVLTKRFAIVALAVAVVAGIVAAFYAAMLAAIQSIAAVLPAEVIQAAGLVVPSNAVAVVSAVLGAQAARWVYDWQVKIIGWKVG